MPLLLRFICASISNYEVHNPLRTTWTWPWHGKDERHCPSSGHFDQTRRGPVWQAERWQLRPGAGESTEDQLFGHLWTIGKSTNTKNLKRTQAH